MNATIEELKALNEKQGKVIRQYEQEYKSYMDTIRVQAETITLMFKPGSSVKELEHCLDWLQKNAVRPEEMR